MRRFLNLFRRRPRYYPYHLVYRSVPYEHWEVKRWH